MTCTSLLHSTLLCISLPPTRKECSRKPHVKSLLLTSHTFVTAASWIVLPHQTLAHCEATNPTVQSLTTDRSQHQFLPPSLRLTTLDRNVICSGAPNPIHVVAVVVVLACSALRGHAKDEQPRILPLHEK
ncbi:hypothetical protein ECG_07574 [Echinococcus granulosus]|nr:hypothetical protein ECG_07574 [Echinococcus granulosus]